MTVFPARPALPATAPPAAPSRALAPIDRRTSAVQPALEPSRPSPVEWARRRRAERDARRLEAAGARALTRLDRLGPAWHIVDWPRTDVAQGYYEPDPADDRAGFLAIGPGGVYAVTVADHGRARVLIAGDVVQINGRRPAYVAEARRDAKRAAQAMSSAVGPAGAGDPGAGVRRLRRDQRARPAQGVPGRDASRARPPAHRRWRAHLAGHRQQIVSGRRAARYLDKCPLSPGRRLPLARCRTNGR